MAVSMRKKREEPAQGPERAAKPDVYEIVARMLATLLVSYLARRLRGRGAAGREGRKARRRVAKLARKGREIPEDLRKEAMKGAGLRKKRKVSSSAKAAAKAAGEKPKGKPKKKKHRILWMIVIATAVLIVRAMKK